MEGPEWLTGGLFGPKGPLQATVFCFAAAVVLLLLARQQKRIIGPFEKGS